MAGNAEASGGTGAPRLSPTVPTSSELTSPVFVAEVGEPPDVAQPDDLPGHGQHKLHLVVPLASILHLLPGFLVWPWALLRGPGDHRKPLLGSCGFSVVCSHGWAGRLQTGVGRTVGEASLQG